MKSTIAAIDFGTSKIVTLVAETSGTQRCDIIGAGIAMSWIVRDMEPADAVWIWNIIQDSLGYECRLETVRDRLVYLCHKPGNRVFVVMENGTGRIGGFLHAADYEVIYSGSLKNIVALAVDPSLQGQGLGKQLLCAVEA